MAALDPHSLVGGEPARALKLLLAHERRVAAFRTRLAGRVAETGSWQGAHRSVADWLADTTGTSLGAARNTLATAGRIAELPLIEEAFEAGKLSEAQATEVARAAEADPEAQPKLLETAEHQTLGRLRKECGRTIAAADPDEGARHERIHRERSLTWGTDADGTWRLRGAFTADAGAAIRSRLEAEYKQVFDQARTDGRRERYDAYMADALLRLCERPPGDDGPTPRRRW